MLNGKSGHPLRVFQHMDSDATFTLHHFTLIFAVNLFSWIHFTLLVIHLLFFGTSYNSPTIKRSKIVPGQFKVLNYARKPVVVL